MYRIDACEDFSQVNADQDVQVTTQEARADPVKKYDGTEPQVTAVQKTSTFNVRVPSDANDQKVGEIVGNLQTKMCPKKGGKLCQIDASQDVQVTSSTARADPSKPYDGKQPQMTAVQKTSTFNVRVPADSNDQAVGDIVGKLQ